TGKYLSHFGTKGNDLKEFNTAHGMVLDTRYDPPRLLICDRNHQPKGRLVHYDLNGEFLGEIVTGLGMPTSAAVQGDYVSVPDLQGRVFPPTAPYLVGREKVREFARAVFATSPLNHDPVAAQEA
ncbi:MAG: hypothetical protein V4719_02575, partial [Planctomycetota bacterium]